MQIPPNRNYQLRFIIFPEVRKFQKILWFLHKSSYLLKGPTNWCLNFPLQLCLIDVVICTFEIKSCSKNWCLIFLWVILLSTLNMRLMIPILRYGFLFTIQYKAFTPNGIWQSDINTSNLNQYHYLAWIGLDSDTCTL